MSQFMTKSQITLRRRNFFYILRRDNTSVKTSRLHLEKFHVFLVSNEHLVSVS